MKPIHVVEKNPYWPQPFVFTEVALCLRDAIRAAGFESEHVVNRIDPEAYSIVLGGTPAFEQELPGMDRRRCAIFNFEQLASNSQLAGPEYRRWLRDWLVLDYHRGNIELLARENGPSQQAFELPIVPTEALSTAGTEPKTVDVLFYGTMSERRAKVLREMEALGLKVEAVAGAYANELAPAVRRARLVVHIHYYESRLFPILRMLQPVAMGVPIVCEESVFSPMNDWSHSGIVFVPYEQLAQACRDLVDAPGRMARRAQLSLAFADHIDFAAALAPVVEAFRQLDAGDSAPPSGGPGRALSNEEIEAILAAEEATPPEAGQPGAKAFDIVKREPGQGPLGAWVAWVLITFMFLGGLRYWFAW